MCALPVWFGCLLTLKLRDKGLIPDFVLRRAIRLLLRERLREIDHGSFETNHSAKMKWIDEVKARAVIADVPQKANEQHYEVSWISHHRVDIYTQVTCQVSTKFMLSTLGPRAKYSSCLYPTGRETLAQAEECMLESYCEKAKLEDGMDILDLGCGTVFFALHLGLLLTKTHSLGWGSLSLFLAKVSDA